MRKDVCDPATGVVRLCADQCTTCIFRPGNPMELEPGRLKDLITKARRDQGHIVCHSTLDTDEPAICRGLCRPRRPRAQPRVAVRDGTGNVAVRHTAEHQTRVMTREREIHGVIAQQICEIEWPDGNVEYTSRAHLTSRTKRAEA